MCNACHAELKRKAGGSVALLLVMARVVLHRPQDKLVFPSAEGLLTETALQKTRSVKREGDGAGDKEPTCRCRRCKRYRLDRWFRKIPWSGKWQPISVFLPGKFHGQRNLEGYSPWSHKESNTTELLNTQQRDDDLRLISACKREAGKT